MAAPTLLMRVVASAYSAAEKAATIVRNVMAAGDLGIVEKVFLLLCSSSTSFIKIQVKLVFLKIRTGQGQYNQFKLLDLTSLVQKSLLKD